MDNVSTMGTTLRPLDDGIHHYPDDESYRTTWADPDVEDGSDPDVEDGDEDGYADLAWPRDSRWRPAAAVLGAVVAVGAIATAVIINSGDSASTKATVGAPVPRTVTSTTTTPKATVPPSAPPSASTSPQLPPETVTTVTTPSAAPSTLPTATPTAAPPLAPTAALNPRTVIYSVTGSKQLLDLVNVTYTDARGYPRTDFNVSLPWSRMIVLNPDVQTVSVVASSFYARLNCSVVNAAGQAVVASANNGNLATCTR